MKTFERDGINLHLPDNWEVEVEDSSEGWSVAAQSPGTAFLLASFDPSMEDPSAMADAALEGLREEYSQLDADSAIETIAGQPSVGFDINFIHLDLTNSCWVRTLEAGVGALLLLGQCTDDELDLYEHELLGIMQSIEIEE
jgi:hypothetical protein